MTPALIVFFLSVLVAIAGLAMIIFTVKLNELELIDKLSEMKDAEGNKHKRF